MPDFDIDDSFNARARDSFNTTTTNSANLNVGLDNVGNTDESVNDSGNVDLGVDGSFNSDSHDTTTDTEIDIDDSGNVYEDNSVDDHSDNSIEDSYNTATHTSTDDSYNTFDLTTVDDHSVNAGVRSYSTGFGDVTVGAAGAAGAGGDLMVDGRATILDNSVNQNIDAYSVDQEFDTENVVASGDGAIAAGDDVDIYQSVDDSTNFTAGGDINMDNVTTIDTVIGSYNTETDASSYTDNSQDWDVDDSFNDHSETYTADNAFNDEITVSSENDWDVDANVIWDSDDAAVVGDVDVDLPPM